MTAVIRRSLVQGVCGVAIVAALSVSSAMDDPVALTMVNESADRVEQTSGRR